jgi:hypothetical protein
LSEAAAGIEYTKVAEIKGPLMIIDGITRASFDELVEIETPDKERRLGRVLEVGYGKAVVQVFEGTTGLAISEIYRCKRRAYESRKERLPYLFHTNWSVGNRWNVDFG